MKGTDKQVNYAKRLLKAAAHAWEGKSGTELAAAMGAPAYEKEAVQAWVQELLDGDTVNAKLLHLVLVEYMEEFSAGWVIDTCRCTAVDPVGQFLRYSYCEAGTRAAAPDFDQDAVHYVDGETLHFRFRYDGGYVLREVLEGETWKKAGRALVDADEWPFAMAYSLESGFARRAWAQESLRSPNFRRAKASPTRYKHEDLYRKLTAIKERVRDGINPLHG